MDSCHNVYLVIDDVCMVKRAAKYVAAGLVPRPHHLLHGQGEKEPENKTIFTHR